MVRAIGIGKEATYGQDVALSKYISAIDESVDISNEPELDFEMGYIGQPKPGLGVIKATHGFKFYLEPENAGLLLLAFFGASSDSVTDLGAGDYKHTYTLKETAQYLTLASIGDLAASQRTMPGYAITGLKISYLPGKKVLVEVKGIPKTINFDALASPSFSAELPFYAHHGDAKIATASDTDIKAMVIELDRVYSEDDFRVGSRERAYCKSQGVKAKVTIDRFFEDLTEIYAFLGGSGTPTSPQTAWWKRQVDINLDSGIDIGGGNNFQFNLQLKECIYAKWKNPTSKKERVIETIEAISIVPAAGEQITAELYNSIASY